MTSPARVRAWAFVLATLKITLLPNVLGNGGHLEGQVAVVPGVQSANAQTSDLPPQDQLVKRRRALLITNTKYANATPGNGDARLDDLAADLDGAQAMFESLRAAGYDVFGDRPLFDLDAKIFNEVVTRFVSIVEPGDLALFVYFGHAVQQNGLNYLLPAYTTVPTDGDAPDAALNLQTDIVIELAKKRPRAIVAFNG